MQIYLGLIALFLVLIACIAILNCLSYPRLGHGSNRALVEVPKVSVLIPAREEAGVIAGTVNCWLEQDYPNFELLVLDDDSGDGTAELARQAAGSDGRFRLLAGEPLPAGWRGKTWACHQLAQAASGQLLLFTDADVRWGSRALSALVEQLQTTRADLLTVWPTQVTGSWSERLVVPLMALTVIGYLPVLAVHYVPWRILSAANGQCLIFRRAAYRSLGGHAGVRQAIVEDMALAASVKRHRLRLRMADGAGLVATRMYHNWAEVRDGFAKSVFYAHGSSLLFLFFSSLFHWSLFVVPWLWFAYAILTGGNWMPGLILAGLGVLVRALTAAVTRQRLQDALALPISVGLMTLIVFRSLRWHLGGGVYWKGRRYGR